MPHHHNGVVARPATTPLCRMCCQQLSATGTLPPLYACAAPRCYSASTCAAPRYPQT